MTLEINTLTQAAGPNLWQAVVHYCENGKAGQMTVQVRAMVEAVVSVQPASLLIHTQTAARGTFILTEHLPNPLTICALSTASPHIRATCSAATREGDEWKRTISLEVLASLPEGRLEDALKIATTDSRYAELSIPFTVIKRSARSGAGVARIAHPGGGQRCAVAVADRDAGRRRGEADPRGARRDEPSLHSLHLGQWSRSAHRLCASSSIATRCRRRRALMVTFASTSASRRRRW